MGKAVDNNTEGISWTKNGPTWLLAFQYLQNGDLTRYKPLADIWNSNDVFCAVNMKSFKSGFAGLNKDLKIPSQQSHSNVPGAKLGPGMGLASGLNISNLM